MHGSHLRSLWYAAAALPRRSQRAHRVLENEKSATFLGGNSSSSAASRQLQRRSSSCVAPCQAFAQPASRRRCSAGSRRPRNAPRRCDRRATRALRSNTYSLRRVARGRRRYVGGRREAPDVARLLEVLDDERTVWCVAHDFAAEFMLVRSGRERTQPRDFALHRGDRGFDLLGGREAAQAEAQRALRQLVAAAERAQHVRRFVRSRRARGARGDRQLAQRELQALAFDAVEADVQEARDALVRMPVQLDVADARDALPEPVAQRADAFDVLLPLALRDLERQRPCRRSDASASVPERSPSPGRRRRSAARRPSGGLRRTYSAPMPFGP